MESISNSFGQQNCSHSRIYSSTYSTDDMTCGTNHGSHFLNKFVRIVTHNPILFSSCNVYDEVFKDVFTERRVCNFRVELKTPPSLGYVFNGHEVSIRCPGHSLEPFRNLMQFISMTHPHYKFFWESSKERRVASFYSRNRCFTILSFKARCNLTAKYMCKFLHTIANTKQWHISLLDQLPNFLRYMWCPFLIHTVWASTQNNSSQLMLS
mmetsp:Transcript_10480/g.17325  ORF Transcript_10480/g.17325 Transcript_10480/m.17325 type:complete len:210 (-) Transcript_10480:341-970(-)